MSAEKNKAVVRQIWEAWNRGEMDSLPSDLTTHDYIVHSPLGGKIKGMEGIKQIFAIEKNAFPDYQDKIENVIAEGNMVAAFFTFSGTFQGELMGNSPNGNKVVLPWAQLNRFAGGNLAETWNYYDTADWFRQLGIPLPQGN
jgi:C-1 hydroxylase